MRKDWTGHGRRVGCGLALVAILVLGGVTPASAAARSRAPLTMLIFVGSTADRQVTVTGRLGAGSGATVRPRRTWSIALQRRAGARGKWTTMAVTRLKAPYRTFALKWKAPAAAGSVTVRTVVRAGPRILARSKPRLVRLTSAGTAPTGEVVSVPTPPLITAPPAEPPATTTPPASTTAPLSSGLPSISGSAQQDATLTANPGTWTGAQPIAFAYRWQRCNSTGASCTPIAGAQASTYTVLSADLNATLRVAVTASNARGTATATSAATAVVTRRPSNTAPPRISGTAREGQRLTANPGTWTGPAPIAFAYAWQRCNTSGGACVPIADETSTTYAVRPGDIGSRLRVAVTATNAGGSATATSNPTSTVTPVPPVGGQVVALWHMDETVGSTMFDSVAGHHGTLHSGVQLGQPGFAGLAYALSGSAHVIVPNAADLQPGSSDITITIRIKTTRVPSSGDWSLIRNGIYETPGGEHKMELYPSGQASCGFNGSAGYSELTTGPALHDGVWHTVQCVKTSNTIQVVVDGQVFSQSATIGTIANTETVTIGTRPDGGEYFQGSIDEASIRIG